jgi:hypothetical protein
VEGRPGGTAGGLTISTGTSSTCSLPGKGA